ncbi:MAG TPA: nucleoside-diphosphate sugar epimerase/dehydratase [Paludibacter sp.]|nr:nucleoside-diphosphate sugar epimerase/dehydratase [Paludibacter sp.]
MEKFQNRMRSLFKVIMRTSLINRWIVFEIDLILCILGYSFATFIQIRNSNMDVASSRLLLAGIVFVFSTSVCFYILKPYRGLIRHSSLVELWRLFVSLSVSCGVLYVFVLLLGYQFDYRYFFVQNVFLISLVLLLMMRYCIVFIYNYTVNYTTEVRNKSLIYEIDMHSIALAQWLNKSAANQHQVQGFVTRNKDAKKTRIHGLSVHSLNVDNLDWFLRKNEVNTIIFPDYKSVRNEQVFISTCIEMGISVLVSPPFEGLDANNKIRFQMKPIQFEDLLGREEIMIDMDKIELQTRDKVILITGAAGSIGSEIVRQLAQFKPKLLLVFDVAETPLHNLRLEMERNYPELKFVPIIGDVRSESRLDFVFRKYKPQIVYHAAAYKHVPLMEENPCEAILVNIMGTMNLSNFAARNNVDSFVMISTDKAVNPTNVMGASKRIAEIYVQALAKESEKKGSTVNFVTTRFGNVLGSNGSVIPHFKEQIENGGPVTVTHPDIIRYFMTIPEACRLVLEAASFGNSGEIYVFDMGSPVKIVDLAKRMIELAGFVPNKDINIEFIGLRPGEKLFEELLNDKEITIPTEHEKITIANVRQYEFEKVLSTVQLMIDFSYKVEIKSAVKMMKELVPEFISKNSPYAEFDN